MARDRPDHDAASLSAVLADITTLDIDAIVNAANEGLRPGGGVCGAIHAAAGPQLARACERVAPCPTGEARITAGFNLPAKYVIHAVGPVWRGGSRGGSAASRVGLSVVARARDGEWRDQHRVPGDQHGDHGYPLPEAAMVAVRTVREVLGQSGTIRRVVFACFDQRVLTDRDEASFGPAMARIGDGP
jgi:O-acetyl-ADP-ribose deacetylase (regulator of RNase III)